MDIAGDELAVGRLACFRHGARLRCMQLDAGDSAASEAPELRLE
jgi:hypothetical protein